MSAHANYFYMSSGFKVCAFGVRETSFGEPKRSSYEPESSPNFCQPERKAIGCCCVGRAMLRRSGFGVFFFLVSKHIVFLPHFAPPQDVQATASCRSGGETSLFSYLKT